MFFSMGLLHLCKHTRNQLIFWRNDLVGKFSALEQSKTVPSGHHWGWEREASRGENNLDEDALGGSARPRKDGSVGSLSEQL